MANRHYSQFKEKKVSDKGPRPATGVRSSSSPTTRHKSTGYSTPGQSSSFGKFEKGGHCGRFELRG